MKFVSPTAEQLTYLRADPLLWEQELDVRPDVAAALERATGRRAGRVYWYSQHDYLYALELADMGRGHPSMAISPWPVRGTSCRRMPGRRSPTTSAAG
jgi:hypothetical protein